MKAKCLYHFISCLKTEAVKITLFNVSMYIYEILIIYMATKIKKIGNEKLFFKN